MRVYRIPIPPTVNNLYRSFGKRRVISQKYKAWKGEARAALLGQRPVKVPGRVVIFLQVPPIANADIDNRNKAAIDLLVNEGVIDDDKNVASVVCSWGSKDDDCAFIGATPAVAMTARFFPTPDGSGGGWILDDNGDDYGFEALGPDDENGSEPATPVDLRAARPRQDFARG